MNTVEVKAKFRYVLESVNMSKEQKELFTDVFTNLLETAIDGINPDFSTFAKATDIASINEKITTINEKNTTQDNSINDLSSKVTTATNTATIANTTANAAKTAAETATNTANAAKTASGTATATANTAKSTATTANTTAGEAKTTATAAKTAADTANTNLAKIMNTNKSGIKLATATVAGGVKQAATVTALEEASEIATVIARVNTLISNLKAAGIVA